MYSDTEYPLSDPDFANASIAASVENATVENASDSESDFGHESIEHATSVENASVGSASVGSASDEQTTIADKLIGFATTVFDIPADIVTLEWTDAIQHMVNAICTMSPISELSLRALSKDEFPVPLTKKHENMIEVFKLYTAHMMLCHEPDPSFLKNKLKVYDLRDECAFIAKTLRCFGVLLRVSKPTSNSVTRWLQVAKLVHDEMTPLRFTGNTQYDRSVREVYHQFIKLVPAEARSASASKASSRRTAATRLPESMTICLNGVTYKAVLVDPPASKTKKRARTDESDASEDSESD